MAVTECTITRVAKPTMIKALLNITEDGGPVRYYAELPKKAETTQEWLQIVSVGRVDSGLSV